jgi:hypothetical protein
MQRYKLNLLWTHVVLQATYTYNIEGTLNGSCGYVLLVTVRVTHLGRCGFQWFLHSEIAKFV